MGASQTAWVDAHGHKMDDTVTQWVQHGQRRVGGWPGWGKSPFRRIRKRLWRTPVIIFMASDCPETYAIHLCQVMRADGGRRVRYLRLVHAIAAEITAPMLRSLLESDPVSKIVSDGWLQLRLEGTEEKPERVPVPGSRHSGAGVTVAVVDTGVAPHPDLTAPLDRLVGFKDFVHGKWQAYDDHGHGTYLAGVAVGNGRQACGRYPGVAPAASVVGVKVLDASGAGRLSAILTGIEWVAAHRAEYKIRVMILGLPLADAKIEDPLHRAVEAARRAGLYVSAPVADEKTEAITAPAPPGSPFCRARLSPYTGYMTYAGPSAAAAVRAGLAAKLFSVTPHLTPAEVGRKLARGYVTKASCSERPSASPAKGP